MRSRELKGLALAAAVATVAPAAPVRACDSSSCALLTRGQNGTLPKGVHQYIYYVRATSAGNFFVAPAVALDGYFPEVFGRSDSSRFVVTP